MYNIFIGPPRFEWDEKKNAENNRKHGVSFEEACTVFLDEDALESADPDHSNGEDRFILVGASDRLRVLMVVHCYREEGGVIRIISARKLDKKEEAAYWELKP